MRFSALLLAAFLPLASLGAAAQDIPSRAGRIAYIDGQAAVFQDPEIGWDKAYVNTPITSENSVWTDQRSRAEVRVSGVALRMDELTQLDVARLDDDDINAFVPRGSMAVRIRHFANDTRFDLATPQGQLRLFGEGRYRVDVDPERDETIFTVFSGNAALRSASGDVGIQAGNAIRIVGGPRPAYYFERPASRDFDRWVASRDERWSERSSVEYVSPYMTGYEDLDAYGQWQQDPELGAIWYPTRVANDWAPYRYGHWAYVRPWGYTWVDDAPWGYAPFHYGRWVNVRNRWAWCPGERIARPVWAPALVAWVGGANVSVGVSLGGGGAVGWYPLSPWDRYDPWFRAPSTYVSQVNIIYNNFNRRGNDRNRRDWREWHERTRERGATVVNRQEFRVNRPVPQAQVRVSSDVVRQLPQANPTQVLPSRTEIVQRRAQIQGSQPQVVAPPPAQAPAGTAPSRQARGTPAAAPQANPAARGNNAPNFARPQSVPAPAAAQGTPPAATPQPPQANSRANREAREQQEILNRERLLQGQQPAAQPPQAPQRPQPEAQPTPQRQQQLQETQRQQREAQQAQQKAQQDAQQAQQRQEAQQAQQRQQQLQETQRQQREAQQAQQRQQQEAQRREQEQQRQQHEQQRQERQRQTQEAVRAQQEQQKAQQEAQRQQREAQQAQQKAQQEAQRQQREAQQAQQKAQQEAHRQQQEAQRQQREAQQPQRPQPQQAQPQQAQPQQAQPQPQNPGQGQGRGRGQPPKDDDKDKDNKDKR